MTEYELSCHCGAVQGRVRLGPDGLNSASRCDCSFCRRRGAMAVTAPLDGVTITKGEEALVLYQFGTNTARLFFCGTCGVYTHHQRRSNPNEFGVNAGALAGVNPADLDPVPWHHGVNHPSDQTP